MNEIFSFGIIKDLLITAVPALISITIHELSHGFIAYKLGDNTAKEMGRLTLNPIKHIDILGLVMIAVIGFGWAKPVPVDMRKFKNPKTGMALTSLAGPLSNIILAVITIFIFLLLPIPGGGYNMFYVLFMYTENIPVFYLILHRLAIINVLLALFNLLPIPPLDGSKIVFSLLPEKQYYTLMRYERYGMFLLIAIMMLGRFIDNFDIFGVIILKPATSLLFHITDSLQELILIFT